jgi:hypothetical protein
MDWLFTGIKEDEWINRKTYYENCSVVVSVTESKKRMREDLLPVYEG